MKPVSLLSTVFAAIVLLLNPSKAQQYDEIFSAIDHMGYGPFKHVLSSSYMQFNKALRDLLLPKEIIDLVENDDSHPFAVMASHRAKRRQLQQTPAKVSGPKRNAQESGVTGTNNCHNGGIPVTVNRIVYTCRGSSLALSKAQYEANVAAGQSCSIVPTATKVCWCPRDYIGKYCDTTNSIICKITDNNYFLNCTNTSSRAFVYSLNSGFPPCNYVDSNTVYTANVSIQCQNANTSILYEGIKYWDDELSYDENSLGLPPLNANGSRFSYAVNDTLLVSSKGITPSIYVAIVNWNKIGLTKSWTVPTTIGAIRGLTTTPVPLTVSTFYSNYSVTGRFTFFLDVLLSGTHVGVNQFMGFLEDSAYKIPPLASTFNWQLLVIVLVLSLVALAIILYLAYRYWKKKQEEEEINVIAEFNSLKEEVLSPQRMPQSPQRLRDPNQER